MNSFYHQVNIGFNWWYIALPITLWLGFLFGQTKYRLNQETFTIMKRGGGDLLLKMVVVVLDTIVHIMVLVESGTGMLQLTANCLPDSDISWCPVILGAWFLVTYALLYNILFSLGKLGEGVKRRKVLDLRSKLIVKEKSRRTTNKIMINL